jgi:hypothetical protein
MTELAASEDSSGEEEVEEAVSPFGNIVELMECVRLEGDRRQGVALSCSLKKAAANLENTKTLITRCKEGNDFVGIGVQDVPIRQEVANNKSGSSVGLNVQSPKITLEDERIGPLCSEAGKGSGGPAGGVIRINSTCDDLDGEFVFRRGEEVRRAYSDPGLDFYGPVVQSSSGDSTTSVPL